MHFRNALHKNCSTNASRHGNAHVMTHFCLSPTEPQFQDVEKDNHEVNDKQMFNVENFKQPFISASSICARYHGRIHLKTNP